MINPRHLVGLINFLMNKKPLEKTFPKTLIFFIKVRETGFIYGHIISFDTVNAVETKGWFKEEISKVV
jgi:hypothetical protein